MKKHNKDHLIIGDSSMLVCGRAFPSNPYRTARITHKEIAKYRADPNYFAISLANVRMNGGPMCKNCLKVLEANI
jgi:hypothetical protein